MIATAELAGYLLAEAGFRAQAVAKWRAVYWMTARPRYSRAGRSQKRFFAFIARISDAKSAALFDLLRAK